MKIITKPKKNIQKKYFFALFVLMITCIPGFSQVASITGPLNIDGFPATLDGETISGQVYTTQSGMSGYIWEVSTAGEIITGQGTEQITVTWTAPTSQQFVKVTYTNDLGVQVAVLIINYYPFAEAIDPASIPQFVDPLPHFAGGLRVDAKAGGTMTVSAEFIQQVALSTGTPLPGGVLVGDNPDAGKGNYAGYKISYNGKDYPAMWPARTIETQQGKELIVQYVNNLNGVKYSDFNILADQTLMMNGYTLNGDPFSDPYDGPIPMVTHLHGGEMPSDSDGGPNSWFMPEGTTGVNAFGPGFAFNASTNCTYPNEQEATTLWYHPHDDGLTRINVYTGLAGYYFIRGTDEETAKLPGWSGDDLVLEQTPTGKSTTFYDKPYLPEIELGIQDRMFNVNGGLYWPVDPPNPDIHPFWTPEFVGDVMVVNGKTWPYLSVAPRKYRFRILEGCNARFLDMWLRDLENNVHGPKITVIGGEGGLLAAPIDLNPADGQSLVMAPGQRYDVIIDFTGLDGKTFTLMNKANSPYPFGDAVYEGFTDRIMQFVVNGSVVSGAGPESIPVNLRPDNPLVQLTDFAGNAAEGVSPVVTRQLILNEVSVGDAPAAVLINNAYFESALAIPGTPDIFGGPTEIPVEGTTEIYQIINISADAHPIHIHLLQWQLMSRRLINAESYFDEYARAWSSSGLDFPVGSGYPGGAGSPYPYNTVNSDGAIGGNPAVSPFYNGDLRPANPEERGWKDDVIVLPNEVTTFITRVAPTDRPIDATLDKLLFPFDPSEGPGYVWHCHIVDHEDMSMMRPLPFDPSPLRTGKLGLLGEVNGDIEVTSTDALILLSCDVKIDVSQYCPMNFADTNGDNLINSTDALIILSYEVEMPVPDDVGKVVEPGSASPCFGCN